MDAFLGNKIRQPTDVRSAGNQPIRIRLRDHHGGTVRQSWKEKYVGILKQPIHGAAALRSGFGHHAMHRRPWREGRGRGATHNINGGIPAALSQLLDDRRGGRPAFSVPLLRHKKQAQTAGFLNHQMFRPTKG